MTEKSILVFLSLCRELKFLESYINLSPVV